MSGYPPLQVIGDYEHGRRDGFVFGTVEEGATKLRARLADGRIFETENLVQTPSRFRFPLKLFVIPVPNLLLRGTLQALDGHGSVIAQVGLAPA